MSDTVIAPDLRERHEQLSKQLRGSKAQQRYAQFTHELIERVSKAEQENVALRAKVAKLEAAISWALGEAGSDFRGRGEGEGAYWWRKQFRIRARGREGE